MMKVFWSPLCRGSRIDCWDPALRLSALWGEGNGLMDQNSDRWAQSPELRLLALISATDSRTGRVSVMQFSGLGVTV